MSTMSYRTCVERRKTFYDGELCLKTGTLSKRRLFALVLQDDPSLYIIDSKLVKRKDGMPPVNLAPYDNELNLSASVLSQGQLNPGWSRFDLKAYEVVPASKDTKCFKLVSIPAEEEESKASKPREERFYTPNVCSRNVWVKKLLQARNQSFDRDDCNDVPMQEIVDFNNELQALDATSDSRYTDANELSRLQTETRGSIPVMRTSARILGLDSPREEPAKVDAEAANARPQIKVVGEANAPPVTQSEINLRDGLGRSKDQGLS